MLIMYYTRIQIVLFSEKNVYGDNSIGKTCLDTLCTYVDICNISEWKVDNKKQMKNVSAKNQTIRRLNTDSSLKSKTFLVCFFFFKSSRVLALCTLYLKTLALDLVCLRELCVYARTYTCIHVISHYNRFANVIQVLTKPCIGRGKV